ncbi:MAG: hypothetical protein ACETWG_06115 [Candidatus Neomarinimicrobiota bacterium]
MIQFYFRNLVLAGGAAVYLALILPDSGLKAQGAPAEAGLADRKLVIQGFIQEMYEDSRYLSDTTAHGETCTSADKVQSSGFRLRRLRLRVSAYWRTGTMARLQLALQQTDWKKILEDAYLQQDLLGNRLSIYLGQLKEPYGREELRRVWELLVVDRGYLTAVLTSNNWASRQQGLMVVARLEPSGIPIRVQLMVANGDGINQTVDPTPLAKLAVGRLTIGPLSWLEAAASVGLQHFGAGDEYYYATPLETALNFTSLSLDFALRLPLSDRLLMEWDGEFHAFDLINKFEVGKYPRFGWAGHPSRSQAQINRGEYRILGVNLTPSLYLQLPARSPVKALDLAARFEHACTGHNFFSKPGFSFTAGEVALGFHFMDAERQNRSRLQLALALLSPSIGRPTQDLRTLKVQWQVRY